MKFEPAIYEHAAKLIGKTPWEVSRSGALIVEGHVAAFETYCHTPVVVGIDIYNLEAEAFGSVIAEPDGDGIPAPHEHLCEEVADILELDDFDPASSGRLSMIIEAAIKGGAAVIISEDFQDGQVVSGVTIRNPFLQS